MIQFLTNIDKSKSLQVSKARTGYEQEGNKTLPLLKKRVIANLIHSSKTDLEKIVCLFVFFNPAAGVSMQNNFEKSSVPPGYQLGQTSSHTAQ